MSEEKVILSRGTDQPSQSLAQMLKGQYTSKEFNDVFAATELREHEIIGCAGVLSARFVCMIMSTDEEDLKGLEGEDLRMMEDRLKIKMRLLRDPNAMVFALEDSFMYGFGLFRQSLKRQSRKEAQAIAMSPRPVQPAGEMSTKDKLFTKLGISRKFKNIAVENE